MFWTHETLRALAQAKADVAQAVRDKEIVSVMLAARPQASLDHEADEAFATAVLGRPVATLQEEGALHRRRVAALGALVRDGRAESNWIGVLLGASHHGARRCKKYWLND